MHVDSLAGDRRGGVEGAIDDRVHWLRSIKWPVWLVVAYGLLIPVLAMHLPGVGGVGAADLLMPFGFLVLLVVPRRSAFQLPHVALAAFCFFALVSLLQILETKPAIDCLIRWVRLLGIFIPFYFGLVIRDPDSVSRTAAGAYLAGGLIAIVAGIAVYHLGIEVRAGQQRLWLDGGSVLRAGGLIGNSGAYGHMTATWTVVCIGWFVAVSKHRLRWVLAAAALVLCLYVVFISSSRAAIMHLVAGLATIAVVLPVSKRTKLWMPLAVGMAAIVGPIFVIGGSWLGGQSGLGSDSLQSNMARFVPGLGGSDVNEFTSNRAGNWPEYIAMVNEKIITGWGYKMGVRIHEESPDNSYLSVMLETGILGFAAMALFVVSVLALLARRCLAGNRLALVLIGVCAGQLVNCMTSDIYTFWITMPVVFLLLGLVVQTSSRIIHEACA